MVVKVTTWRQNYPKGNLQTPHHIPLQLRVECAELSGNSGTQQANPC
jgi:hypothetical protein